MPQFSTQVPHKVGLDTCVPSFQEGIGKGDVLLFTQVSRWT